MKNGLLIAALALLLPTIPARADVLREINEARGEGCGAQPGVSQPLRASAKLEQAARQVARGEPLSEALEAAQYFAIKSTSIHMSGWLTDGAIARIFSKRFCNSLSDAQLRDIGWHRERGQVWLVLAQPFSALALRDPAAVNRRVLELVNEARSHARHCGSQIFTPAGPLQLSSTLQRAALEHSRDMARHNYFEHQGWDGSSPAQRVTAQGYKWRVVGENLAAGVTTPEETVQGWLGSPHHCANLMDPRFTETATAYIVEPASKMGIYWTQLFAVPRK